MEGLIVVIISIFIFISSVYISKIYLYLSNISRYRLLKRIYTNFFIEKEGIIDKIKFDYIDDIYEDSKREFCISSRVINMDVIELVIIRAILTRQFYSLPENEVKEFVNYIGWIEGFKEVLNECNRELLEQKLKNTEEKWKELYIRTGIAWIKSSFRIDDSLKFKNYWGFKYQGAQYQNL